MQLDVTHEEVRLLTSILRDYLSNLRMEITNTDEFPLREQLKKREAIIKSLLARLG